MNIVKVIKKEVVRPLTSYLWPFVMAIGILTVLTYPAFRVACVVCKETTRHESTLERAIINRGSEPGDGDCHLACVPELVYNVRD